MTTHTAASLARAGRWLTLVPVAALLACGGEPEELTVLRQDLDKAHAAIDSLDQAAQSANVTIDGFRHLADSLATVDTELVARMQALSTDVRHWRDLAAAEKRKSDEFRAALARMQEARAVDQQIITRIRTQADSLYSALNVANAAIRRQSDHITDLEQQLTASQHEAEALREAQVTVGLFIGSAADLEKLGYLNTKRTMGRAFLKDYELKRRLDAADAALSPVRVPLSQYHVLAGRPTVILDRYGPLREDKDYRLQKKDGAVTIVFVNDMLKGTDVLAVID